MKQAAFAIAMALAGMSAAVAAPSSETASTSSSAKKVLLGDGALTQEGATNKDGKWVLPGGAPTYHLQTKDGKVTTLDWYSYSGFRRYHSECHVCHGPEGEGSTYAPALVNSLKAISYEDYLGIVASGRTRNEAGTDFVMPAFGDNKNVMCYIDDIYVYLKARADGALPRGRPTEHDDKPKQASAYESACTAP
jgi:methanol metabolism-related c-type cytochrome